MGDRSVYIHDILFGDAPLTLSTHQLRRLLRRGDVLVNRKKVSGAAAGMVWSPTGSLTLQEAGRYEVQSAIKSDKGALRNAQFICGIFGLLIINTILFLDRKSRLDNIKDFAINFSSDILAVGLVLVLAEVVDERRRQTETNRIHDLPAIGTRSSSRGGVMLGDSSDDEEIDMHRKPLQAAIDGGE